MREEYVLISFIIPTFKRKEEFSRALNCALAQTYPNKEIIVIDDNSENLDYRTFVGNEVSKHKEVKLVQNRTNLGGALSRNEGIKHARGELIAFLDDDDECVPERLEKQFKTYQENKDKNLGLVYSNDRGIDFDKNLIFQHMQRIIAMTSSWLIPKEVLLDLGCFEDLPSEQDTTLLFKLLKANYSIFFVPEDLIIWNKHTSKNGISGVKPKNIIGTEKLRELYRANYDLLDNKRQIKDVEFKLSEKLFPKYICNDKRKEARQEIYRMASIKPFSLKNAKNVIKYLFPNIVKRKYL